VVVRDRRGCSGEQRNKMRPLMRNSNARWRRVFWRELLWRYSEFHREGNFSESKLSGFSPAVFKICRAPHETGFFYPAVFYSCRAPCGCYVWRIFLSVLLHRQPCTAKLLNSLSINPPKSLCACSQCFISRRAKSITPVAKTALREIFLRL
jgi:hypothetical protein